MATTLRQVLTYFENTPNPPPLPFIARELNLPPERLAGMVRYWVNRGRIVDNSYQVTCTSCDCKGACPLIG